MRFSEHLYEATVKEMATEFVSFQNWITKEVMDKTKDPDKAQKILLESFKRLEQDIKKAIRG